MHQNNDTKFVFPLVESAVVIKNATYLLLITNIANNDTELTRLRFQPKDMVVTEALHIPFLH